MFIESLQQLDEVSPFKFSTAMDLYGKYNKEVNLRFELTDVPSISENISKEFGKSAKFREIAQSIPESVQTSVRDVYETWQLINELLFIDKLHYDN